MDAVIRYHVLDECFRNFSKKFFIEDLIQACNDVLYDYGKEVKRRQIFLDIVFMQSEAGWSIPLDKIQEGKRVYYRYSDKLFSIRNCGITQSEVQQLKETLSIISRFKGLPQFDWIDEIQVRFEEFYKGKEVTSSFVSFQENPYLKGMEHYFDLFNAIKNKCCIKITYKGIKEKSSNSFVFHPWYLKQYNNRWFLFGFNTNYQNMSNLAIDRIQLIESVDETYIENTQVDFFEYFEDIVGVSKKDDKLTEKIVLKVDMNTFHYIDSKPIHGSQKIRNKGEKFVIIELDVQINYEIKALLFSYMDEVEILEPSYLRNEFLFKSKSIYEKYLKK